MADDTLNAMPSPLATTSASEQRSSTPIQFFSSSNQTRRKKARISPAQTSTVASEAALRESLVANEIECTRRLTEAKIRLLEAENQARLELISQQTSAAEKQTNFWLAAAAAMRTFGEGDREQFRGFSDLIRTVSFAESVQQTESGVQHSKESTAFIDSTHDFYTGSQVVALTVETAADDQSS